MPDEIKELQVIFFDVIGVRNKTIES